MKKEHVERGTIALMTAGSQAYGTNVEGSDTDLRGVVIPPDPRYYLGFNSSFEQYTESEPEDLVLYDLRKAFRLMANCNPNMLEMLFTEEHFYTIQDGAWRTVLQNRERFLSKKVKHTYCGYAHGQMKRIRTARKWLLSPPKKRPERSDFGLPVERILSKEDVGAFQWVLANLLRSSLDHLNFSDVTRQELLSIDMAGHINRGGVPDEAFWQVQKYTGASDAWMSIMHQEQAYGNAKRNWDSYHSWSQSRNKKRAALEAKFGYDVKHAMHLVRLLRMGKEILETGQVNVWRDDREELVSIRNGAWSYEQTDEYADKMYLEIGVAAKNSTLPDAVDKEFLDELCSNIIYERLWGR